MGLIDTGFGVNDIVDEEEEEEEDAGRRVEDSGALRQFELDNSGSIEEFDFLRAQTPSRNLEQLPNGLRIGLWNCRGIRNKELFGYIVGIGS